MKRSEVVEGNAIRLYIDKMDSPNGISGAGNKSIVPEIVAENGKQLLELPDDCLIDICRHLSLENLGSLALTCSRLHAIASQTFSLKPENKRVDIHQLLRAFGPNSSEKIERFFQSFGSLLCDVTLDLTDASYVSIAALAPMNEPIFNFIAKHCNGGALESIRMSRITLTSPHSEELLRLFSQLKKIRLDYCCGFSKVLSVSKECVHLHISGRDWTSDFELNCHFPNLETFILRYNYIIMSKEFNANCTDFLQRHTKLKILKLHTQYKMEFDVNAIAGLKKLEVLKLDHCEKSGLTLSPLRNLKRLKTIAINSDSVDAAAFLLQCAAAECLEYLALESPVITKDFLVGLSRLKNLRTLKLTSCDDLTDEAMRQLNLDELTHLILEWTSGFSVDGLADMADKYQKLESITLFNSHHIDPMFYDKLVKVCRKQKRKLTVILCFGTPSNGINYDTKFTEIIFKNYDEYADRKTKRRRYFYTTVK